jgi:hypothetical protein
MHHANISFVLHSLDLVNKEPELEVQAEEINPEPEQGKPQCIIPQSLNFTLFNIFMLRMLCIRLIWVYWNRSYIMNTFWVTLNDLASIWMTLAIARRRHKLR